MTWVYWRSETALWTVGYYKPDGVREPESDHASADDAARRVHYLNGGADNCDGECPGGGDCLCVQADRETRGARA